MPDSPIAALVAGATGYTGREVVRCLRDRGVRVVAHVRPDSSSLAKWRARFEESGAEILLAPWDEAAMTEALAELRPTHVFALLGTTRKRAGEAARRGEDAGSESYEKVDYGLTSLLLRAAKASGSVRRFVYLSSVGVSEEPSRSAYMEARRKLEGELRSSGVPFTIARPSFITGPDREETRTAERVGAAVFDGLLAASRVLGAKSFAERYRSTDARTLAAGLVRAAFEAETENATIEGARLRS